MLGKTYSSSLFYLVTVEVWCAIFVNSDAAKHWHQSCQQHQVPLIIAYHAPFSHFFNANWDAMKEHIESPNHNCCVHAQCPLPSLPWPVHSFLPTGHQSLSLSRPEADILKMRILISVTLPTSQIPCGKCKFSKPHYFTNPTSHLLIPTSHLLNPTSRFYVGQLHSLTSLQAMRMHEGRKGWHCIQKRVISAYICHK